MPPVGWDDYYTTWSAGFLVVAHAMVALFGEKAVLRMFLDAACINSLMVGVLGPFVSCVIPSFENANECRRRRLFYNAVLHAVPAAYATVLILTKPVRTPAFNMLTTLVLFFGVYTVWPTTSGKRFVERIKWAYGVKQPIRWMCLSVIVLSVFLVATRLNASFSLLPNCKGDVLLRVE